MPHGFQHGPSLTADTEGAQPAMVTEFERIPILTFAQGVKVGCGTHIKLS